MVTILKQIEPWPTNLVVDGRAFKKLRREKEKRVIKIVTKHKNWIIFWHSDPLTSRYWPIYVNEYTGVNVLIRPSAHTHTRW